MNLGMITPEGLLLVNRKGAFIPQICPYTNQGLECGDWCPHFHEPVEISGSTINLQLCHRDQIVFTRLDDFRTADRFVEEEPENQEQGIVNL